MSTRHRPRHLDHRPDRQPEHRQVDALRRPLRAPAAGRQLPGRDRREEARRGVPRRPAVDPRRPARHLQPRPPLARRDGRRRRSPRPASRRARPRRRPLRGRRRQPGAQPLPDQPGPRAGPADGHRADHGRRGPGSGAVDRLDRLSRQLGVPVVPVQAHRGIGMEPLKKALAAAGAAGGCSGEPVSRMLPRRGRPSSSVPDGRWQRGQRRENRRLPRYLVERLLLDVGRLHRGAVCRLRATPACLARRARRRAGGWPRPAARSRPSRRWRGTAGSPGWSTASSTRPDRAGRHRGETASTPCSRTGSGERWSWRS